MANQDDDVWDVFGSDDDDDDDKVDRETGKGDKATSLDDNVKESNRASMMIVVHLSQVFLKNNPEIYLSQRKVLLMTSSCAATTETDPDEDKKKNCSDNQYVAFEQSLLDTLKQRRFNVLSMEDTIDETFVDAIICLDQNSNFSKLQNLIQQSLCPGGTIITTTTKNEGNAMHTSFKSNVEVTIDENDILLKSKLLNEDYETIAKSQNGQSIIAMQKKSCQVHASTCPWLPSSHSIQREEQRLHEATIIVSTHEIHTSQLTQFSMEKAVDNIKEYGYCIIPQILDVQECIEWGKAVLQDVHKAAQILLKKHSVDIYHPHTSKQEPQSYRELSMREDLRLDIRQGPALSKLRTQKGDDENGNQSVVLSGKSTDYCNGIFLRGHASLLEIIRKCMNPIHAILWRGNIGRWNFHGSGPTGSVQDLRVSPVGGIVSLPGSADQAIHADTAHLFEHIGDLPPHYINVFAPCTPFHEQVGGTAFIHESHTLEFTSILCGDGLNGNSELYPYLVRPCLTVGDVILFDCRILHFGLANTSSNIKRCICYTNTWQNWFHDAKNWDKHHAIFDDNDYNDSKRRGKRDK